ncbi:MAG: thioredoxin [Candidatus Marinimicrobia bacterium]|jgi:thioredoxin 1|nr:thioredoxin [Candidatus Neomarinimicrobiota bacterium]
MFGLFTTESKTVHVTDATWNEEVENCDGVVLVDVWAPWCGPCKLLGPLIDEISNEYDGKAKICKLNSDENNKSQELGIRGIPTMLFFKNGKLVDKIVGAQPRNNITEKIDSLL